VDLHRAVRVGGVTIQPGDLIHADANGVTTIPLEIAAELADAAFEYVKAENIVLDYLKLGKPEGKAFAEARKRMLAEIGALSRRVRGKSALA
jgi:regulator of RNase E activity RraA